MFFIKVFLIIGVITLGILVTLLNPGEVTLNYAVAQGTFPLSYVIGGAFAAGAIIGFVLSGLSVLKWRTASHRWQKKAEHAISEVENLRKVPLK